MRMKVTIEVCDTCEDAKREVKTYKVEADGQKVTAVLCSIHARPLEVFLGNAKPTGRPPAAKSRVTTIDEIEKAKKATTATK